MVHKLRSKEINQISKRKANASTGLSSLFLRPHVNKVRGSRQRVFLSHCETDLISSNKLSSSLTAFCDGLCILATISCSSSSPLKTDYIEQVSFLLAFSRLLNLLIMSSNLYFSNYHGIRQLLHICHMFIKNPCSPIKNFCRPMTDQDGIIRNHTGATSANCYVDYEGSKKFKATLKNETP